ncbi:unnamed protein product [Blepharisma stoltei]|uniref:C2 domain-containing protein n=1 Tax=Blepharisma stoltei TaxID=1481888 RepID=A0AAU9J981_9CILI|nr:unnamed protein product [Blepharisma stoltei]
MGDCASRPSEKELEMHITCSNPKNDQHFQFVPYTALTEISVQNETNIYVLESKKKQFQRKKLEYQYKHENALQGVPQIPELNIEVQKGANFYSDSFCISQGNPYVSVSLEPNGPKIDTYISDRYRPYWYRFIQFKQSLWSYKSVVFKVMMRSSLKGDQVLGTHEVNLKSLEDQNLYEGWYNLSNCTQTDKIPALRLRMQLTKDEKMLWAKLIATCDEKLKRIEKRIEEIHESSYSSN